MLSFISTIYAILAPFIVQTSWRSCIHVRAWVWVLFLSNPFLTLLVLPPTPSNKCYSTWNYLHLLPSLFTSSSHTLVQPLHLCFLKISIMDVIPIYAVIASGIVSLFLLHRLNSWISQFINYVSVLTANHLTYPYLLHRHRFLWQ